MEYSTRALDTQNDPLEKKIEIRRGELSHLRDPLLPTPSSGTSSGVLNLLKQMKRDKVAFGAALLLTVIIMSAVFAPLLSPYDKDRIDLTKQYLPPSISHPFGTDDMGRDFFSRVMWGGRISLSVGFMAIMFSLILGLLSGGIAGYYGGIIDTIIMRLVDLMLSIPVFFIILFLAGTMTGNLLAICFLIGLTQWMEVARLVRAGVISTKNMEFVSAAKALGITDKKIIGRHILPHTTAPVLVSATLGMASAIIIESSLSFLGFGVQPPTPSWGAMLQNAQGYLGTFPWIAIFPGMMIFLTVTCCYILGDFLSIALNPIKETNRP